MKVLFTLLLSIACVSLFAQDDKEGSSDHPLFSRMNNYYIYEYDSKSYELYKFYTAKGGEEIGGKYTYIGYWAKSDIANNPPSASTIIKNHIQAAKKAGGEIMYESSQQAIIRIKKDKAEVWADVQASSGSYRVKIVEKELMKQEVTADAAWMKSGLDESGKVALYGIQFDFGKATLRPESAPIIEEIAKLLKANPTVVVFIVGHTDNVGGYQSNLKLSNDRASTVVNALITQHKVPAKQMIPFGAGPTSPVATNSTEEGRQLNRRVELVRN